MSLLLSIALVGFVLATVVAPAFDQRRRTLARRDAEWARRHRVTTPRVLRSSDPSPRVLARSQNRTGNTKPEDAR